MKSKIEEKCKMVFHQFLERSAQIQDIEWEDVPQEQEPPDYYLRINDTCYGVEVTSIFEMVDLDGKQFSSATISSSLLGLAKSVEKTALTHHILHGAYVVAFEGPVPELSKKRNLIYRKLLAYIEDSYLLEEAPEEVIFDQPHQQISIKKSHTKKNYVGVIEMGSGKWEAEVADELCVLLDQAITTKAEKLKNCEHPVILLLFDAYHFADLSMYQACLNRCDDLGQFHSLFLVQNDDPGILLHSASQEWLVNLGQEK